MRGASAAEANLVISAEPILIAILAVIFLHEKLQKIQKYGLLIGFLGLYVLIMQVFVPRFEGEAFSNAVMVGALVFECAASITGKALTDKYPGLYVVTIQFAISAILSLPLAIMEISRHPIALIPMSTIFSVVYVCLGSSCFAFGVWYWLLPRYDVSTMSGFLFIQPMAGPFLAWLIRGEKIGPATFAGAALVLGGVWMVAIMGGKAREFHEPAPEPAAFP